MFMTKRTSGELKRLAREFLNGNYTVMAVSMLASFLIPALLLSPFTAGLSPQLDAVMAMYLAAAVIVEILSQLLSAGLLRMHLRLAQNQPFTWKDLFWTFRSCPDRFILAAVILTAILLVPALPAAGCVVLLDITKPSSWLMIAVAVLAAAAVQLYVFYMFGLVYPLYIDNPQMTVAEGFRRSRQLMKGNKMRRFWLDVSFAGWNILGVLSAGIGILWISPYIRQTSVNFYLDLTGQLDAAGEGMQVSG
jgi:uncharacterized membrane protein